MPLHNNAIRRGGWRASHHATYEAALMHSNSTQTGVMLRRMCYNTIDRATSCPAAATAAATTAATAAATMMHHDAGCNPRSPVRTASVGVWPFHLMCQGRPEFELRSMHHIVDPQHNARAVVQPRTSHGGAVTAAHDHH